MGTGPTIINRELVRVVHLWDISLNRNHVGNPVRHGCATVLPRASFGARAHHKSNRFLWMSGNADR